MALFIRTAELSDSESITELSAQLGYDALDAEIQSRLKAILEHADNCVFVAVQNGTVVGWIHGFYALRVETDFFVEIGGLVVSEKVRKSGIGKKLVDKVSEWSLQKNCGTVRVRCNVIRTESHRFYEKIGFELNKEQKVFKMQLNN